MNSLPDYPTLIFPTSHEGKYIHLLWPKPLQEYLTPYFAFTSSLFDPIHQKNLLALHLNYTQNVTPSHYLHHYHFGLNYHHFLPKQSNSVLTVSLHSLMLAQQSFFHIPIRMSFQNVSQVLSHLCPKSLIMSHFTLRAMVL